MAEQVPLRLGNRNPDVLTCIANLSNDEVFTPPDLANRMLDLVTDAWADAHHGASIWADPSVRFLDPFTKSGVFLREITSRLTEGLRDEIPDLQERVDHILTKQVYGIGITRLTSLIARRSVYCSKRANGKHSIARSFTSEDGNIWFEPSEHTWVGATEIVDTAGAFGSSATKGTNGRCLYCGANQKLLDRGQGFETHAYATIHTSDIKKRMANIFGDSVQFDVIVGNPPYQLNDGGGAGASATPIYQKFIQQALLLRPRLLSMVVPARWYSGGKGLDEFRATMLADRRLRYLADFPDSRQAFDGVDVAGGVCYFLWERDNEGECIVDTFTREGRVTAERRLDEFQTFVRDNRALAIVHKVLQSKDPSLSAAVSSRKPFGLESAQRGDPAGELYLFASGRDGTIRREDVPKGLELIDAWKVLFSKTSSEHAGQTDSMGKKRVLSRIEVMPPESVCTESYLVLGPFDTEAEATNAAAYLRTRFVRFLLSTILLTQNISKKMFEFVPIQDFSTAWTDQLLYSKYALRSEEIAYIESIVKPLEAAGG